MMTCLHKLLELPEIKFSGNTEKEVYKSLKLGVHAKHLILSVGLYLGF